MTDANQLTLTFMIREDLTSERASQYRSLVLRGLEALRITGEGPTNEEDEMISRMFYDYDQDPHVIALLEAQRSIARELDSHMNAGKPLDSKAVVDLEAADSRIGEVLKRFF